MVMVASPQPFDLQSQINDLKQRVTNLVNRGSAPAATKFTDGNGIVRLEISSGSAGSVNGSATHSSGPTIIRDQAGNVTYSDDATAGWGVGSPSVSVPWSATNASARGFFPWTGSDVGEQTMFNAFAYIDHSTLNWSYVYYQDGSTSTVSYRMTYNGSTIPGSTASSTGTTGGIVVSGTMSLPQADFGTIKQISMLQHQTAGVSGVGDAFSTPRYLIMTHA